MKSDKEVLESKINIINDKLEFLKQEKEEFGDDSEEKTFLAVKHALQETIEACLDIANHIISAESLGTPSSYSEYFDKLKRQGIISKNLERNLKEMAKFRNVLVHLYDDVERKRVKNILDEDLNDVKEYVKAIYRYMEK